MDNPRDRASTTNPAHWTTFDQAVRYAAVAGLDGIGRVLVESDGLVGIDLDACRDPETGELADWAAAIVKRLDTYCEVSPSGTGVKLWAFGALPPHGRKKGDIELYASARYFTLTGRHLEGTPATVGYRPDAVLAIHREVFGDAPDFLSDSAENPDRPTPALQLGDDDVLRLASESAHNGERFKRLWAGETGDYAVDGNDGASEADAALCELLAYYGGPDPERIDRLYRRSGLARDKWDRADYRTRTIDLAVRGKTRFYGDSIRQTPAAIGTDGAETGVAGLRARAAYLEGALLDRDDLIEYQQSVIRHERAEKERLAEQVKGWRVVLSNPKLKPADRIAALPAIEHVLAARANGQAEIHIRYPGIVNGWGLPESTLGKSMDILTEPDGAPLAKRSEPGPAMTVETKRGPRSVTPPMTILRATVGGDLYAAVGAYDPQLPQRGGRREQPPACPDHPAATEYVERTVPQCGACRRPLEPARERTLSRRQNEGLTDEAAPTVSVRTLGRHFEGLTDGHVEQPSWLDGWPDLPDLAHTVRSYDDVAIARGAP